MGWILVTSGNLPELVTIWMGEKRQIKVRFAGDMSRVEEELSRGLKAFLGFGNGTLFLQENAEWSALTQPVPCWHSKWERDTILSWAWPSCYVIWQRVG